MTMKERLSEDLKDAMRSRDETRKVTLRGAMAAIRNGEIAAGRLFEDDDVSDVLRKEVKQRRDSIDEFQRGGRQDLVNKETAEMQILREYLPQSLERDQIAAEARQVIAEVGAEGPRDKGKVMGPLLKRLAGRAEGRDVNEVVSELLTGS
jgi:uncharacterized protein YqeY